MDDRESPPNQTDVRDMLAFLGDRVFADSIPPGLTVSRVAALAPGRRGAVSFARGSSLDRIDAVLSSQSSLILVEPAAYARLEGRISTGIIAVENPRREFARIVAEYFTHERSTGVSASAVVADSAEIGSDTYVGPGAYVDSGVVVGQGCRIGANSVLLEGTVVGSNTSIGPNSTIGHVGFGYEREGDGSPVLVPHLGGVTIGSHVDIGANTCIDRGTLHDTVIEDHAKIDNLVHIGHNCVIERGSFVIAGTVLGGGVVVGERAWVGINASVLQKRRVGPDATVGMASAVLRDVNDGTTVFGTPAREVKA